MSLKNKIKIAEAKFFGVFFPNLVKSDMKIAFLKSIGMKIGKGTFIYNAGKVSIDKSRPELIEIGEYCKIAGGAIILAHDYSRSVLRRAYGDVVAEARKTVIGDNVFIGMNAILLMGTQIGNNCIVGAGSVCHGIFPDNCVIAGNPAKIICSLDDYYEKRKARSVTEAKEYARILYEKKGRAPTIKEMGAFYPLYLTRSREALKQNNIFTAVHGDSEDELIEYFLSSTPLYGSFEEFLKDAGISNG